MADLLNIEITPLPFILPTLFQFSIPSLYLNTPFHSNDSFHRFSRHEPKFFSTEYLVKGIGKSVR